MQTDLKNLLEVKAGDNFLDVLTSLRMNSIQRLIREIFFGDNVSVGGGITKSRNANGYTLLTTPSVANPSSEGGIYYEPGTPATPGTPPGPNGEPGTPGTPGTPGGTFYNPGGGAPPVQLRPIELELCDGTVVHVMGY